MTVLFTNTHNKLNLYKIYTSIIHFQLYPSTSATFCSSSKTSVAASPRSPSSSGISASTWKGHVQPRCHSRPSFQPLWLGTPSVNSWAPGGFPWIFCIPCNTRNSGHIAPKSWSCIGRAWVWRSLDGPWRRTIWKEGKILIITQQW